MRRSGLLTVTVLLLITGCASRAVPVGPVPVGWGELEVFRAQAVEALDSIRTRTVRGNMDPLALATRPGYPRELRELIADLGRNAGIPVHDVTRTTLCRTDTCGFAELRDVPGSTILELSSVRIPSQGGVVFTFRTDANYHTWTATFSGSPDSLRFTCFGQSERYGPRGI